ncbi:MAG TPA: DUF5996 family protein [Candidatus Baltobacteraceae bacterium]|nr:DUF5996 family protein [Candidatus Baltobacteraceae bacterium]
MERWPQLRYDEWKDTLQTLQLWTQIVGKIRLRQEPMVNHWWNVTLYVTQRGLGTSPMPYRDGRTFAIDFDFIDRVLRIADCDAQTRTIALAPMSVAAFYGKVMHELAELGITIRINTKPNEVADAIPFEADERHASYDSKYVERFWRALLQIDRLCKAFRARFVGKSSPVHFFWGSFDLAVSLFSGRTAPPHPGGIPNLPDSVTREAYSREEMSFGFWPGGNGLDASFYGYAYPEPAGLAEAKLRPGSAAWSPQLREFLLPYESVRGSSDPDDAVLSFFSSVYDAGASLARWDESLHR